MSAVITPLRPRTKPQLIIEAPVDTRTAIERAYDVWNIAYPVDDRKHESVMVALRKLGAADQTIAEARAESEHISLLFAARAPRRWCNLALARGIEVWDA